MVIGLSGIMAKQVLCGVQFESGFQFLLEWM